MTLLCRAQFATEERRGRFCHCTGERRCQSPPVIPFVDGPESSAERISPWQGLDDGSLDALKSNKPQRDRPRRGGTEWWLVADGCRQ